MAITKPKPKKKTAEVVEIKKGKKGKGVVAKEGKKMRTVKKGANGKRLRRTALDKVKDKFSTKFNGSADLNSSAVYAIKIIDREGIDSLPGQLLAISSYGVTFRHKKTKASSALRVSHIPMKDIISISGSIGEPAILTVKKPVEIAAFSGTVKFSKSGNIATIENVDSGETHTVLLSNSRFHIELFTDELSTSGSKRGKKGKKRKVEEDDFED